MILGTNSGTEYREDNPLQVLHHEDLYKPDMSVRFWSVHVPTRGTQWKQKGTGAPELCPSFWTGSIPNRQALKPYTAQMLPTSLTTRRQRTHLELTAYTEKKKWGGVIRTIFTHKRLMWFRSSFSSLNSSKFKNVESQTWFSGFNIAGSCFNPTKLKNTPSSL